MIIDKILTLIPDGKVKIKQHGSDPRNYKVNFNKVREVLGFVPSVTIDEGIKELINAFNNKIFSLKEEDVNGFGNYTLDN